MEKAIKEALKYSKILAANCYAGVCNDFNDTGEMPTVHEFIGSYSSLVNSYERKIIDDDDLYSVLEIIE